MQALVPTRPRRSTFRKSNAYFWPIIGYAFDGIASDESLDHIGDDEPATEPLTLDRHD